MDHITEIPVRLLPQKANKTREYKLYQKKVGKFIPLPGYVWDKDDSAKKLR
jgi:hypothetical protein